MKNEFKADFQGELDPLDGHPVEFPWDDLYAHLGETAYTDAEISRLANAIATIVRWIMDCSPSTKTLDRAIGRRAIALAWVLSPGYLPGSPSLRELARRLGVSPQVLSAITSSASREFGIRNRAQAHGWNWKADAALMVERKRSTKKRLRSFRRPRARRASE